MQDHELAAYLGDAYDETTDEQREAMQRAEAAINERYDDEDARREAFTAAVQMILGDTSPWETADATAAARLAYERALWAQTGAIIARVEAAPTTLPETALAREFRTTRDTVRKALGK